MNIQDVRLDFDKKTGVAQWVTIGQGDKGGTTIRATVFDNDVAAALTGMSARFEMRMPNATYFEDTNCTIDGNVITYVVDESHAALYAGGESVAYFALYDGETAIYSTERFHVRVARAASDGANPGHAWTNGIEEWLDEASDTLDDAVADANSRVGATINAANAAVEQMRSDVDEAISDTEEVIDRAEDAIEAMGDISELAVPEMSADVRGGAKLEEHGGLALRDGALGIGSLVQQSDGYARGGLAEVTAKGHAEQVATTGKNLLPYNLGNATEMQIALSLNAGTYTFSADFNGAVLGIRFNYESGSYHTGDMTSNTTFTLTNDVMSINYGYSGDARVSNPQLELGSTATSYEPYTGGLPSPRPDWEQPIEVVRGRNLLDASRACSHWSVSENTITKVSNDGYWQGLFAPTGGALASVPSGIVANLPVIPAGTYTLSGSTSPSGVIRVYSVDSSGTATQLKDINSGNSGTFTIGADTRIEIRFENNSNNLKVTNLQLERGSVAHPYVPYGYVGMEVRDPDTDELISCTALPLPQRGWVAGLPDGTADSLRLDGAGKCEWTLPTSEVVLDGSETWTWSNQGFVYTSKPSDCVTFASAAESTVRMMVDRFILNTAYAAGNAYVAGANILLWYGIGSFNPSNATEAQSWLSTHNVTVFYPLATPVTEDCGYVDMPEISGECQVSIPELDAIGIKYFVDDTITQYGREIYARAYAELGDAITELSARVAVLEQ